MINNHMITHKCYAYLLRNDLQQRYRIINKNKIGGNLHTTGFPGLKN